MRKAILTKFIHLLFLALVLNTFIALVVTSSVLLKRSREDMHFALESVDRMLDYTGNVEEQLMDLSDLTNDNNSRYTLIRMDGTVVADTEVTQVNQMENHLERKEVKDALATGYGYSVRRSGTLGMQMAYAAIRSSDGKYILRLSACSTGLGEYILMLIPAAFLSFGIAFFASAMEAERFSQSITRPLQEISSEMVRMDDDYTRFQFEKCPYEEINVIADTTTRMSRNMKKYLERILQHHLRMIQFILMMQVWLLMMSIRAVRMKCLMSSRLMFMSRLMTSRLPLNRLRRYRRWRICHKWQNSRLLLR